MSPVFGKGEGEIHDNERVNPRASTRIYPANSGRSVVVVVNQRPRELTGVALVVDGVN